MALIKLSGLNQRRWNQFKKNRRGYWSFWIFTALFVISLFAPLIANDRPLLMSYKGELLFPLWKNYPETKFGGFLATTDYRMEANLEEINANGWMIWPPIRYSYGTENKQLPAPAPTKPAFQMSWAEACAKYALGEKDPSCVAGNMNWLGTDDHTRDVLARVIYGFQISVAFGLLLALSSSMIGIILGAVQGYFGGWTDLILQRFIEVWTSMPTLYLLIIISAFVTTSFWILLGILVIFSWTALVGLVRAEFLRARNFEYVRAARALGLSNTRIMWKHLLPNAMVSTVTFMPFIISGAIVTLTALDYLGFGLAVGSASLGELLSQGKNNTQAPWLGLTAFFVLSLILTLLIFAGEAVRDALDPRKTLT